MTAFMLDASLADEATPATDALLDRLADEEAAAPALWRLEVANALAMAERRPRLSVAGLTRSEACCNGLPSRSTSKGPIELFANFWTWRGAND